MQYDSTVDLIREFNNDENFIKLKSYYYDSLSFMDILGVARNENAHSSFLAWLLDANRNHIGTLPLKLLLELLVLSDSNNVLKNIDKNKILSRSLIISQPLGVDREFYIKKVRNGRIDVYIPFETSDKKYTIILENKVKAKEEKLDNKMQTDRYFEYFSEGNDNGEVEYIYVFLAPSQDEPIKASNSNFINISYSMLVENVINPLLLDEKIDKKVAWILEDYLRILNIPNISNTKNSEIVLAVTKQEKELIDNIKDKYDNLYKLLITAVKQGENDTPIYHFLEYNRAILCSIWPDLQPKRPNRKFSELGIKDNSVLYLTQTENRADPDPRGIKVYTCGVKNMVRCEDGEVMAISAAARKYASRDYDHFNGFSWFIYDGQILSKIESKKNDE